MNDGEGFYGCLFATGVMSAWALIMFFLARSLLGFVAGYLALTDFEVSLLAAVLAVVSAFAVERVILRDS